MKRTLLLSTLMFTTVPADVAWKFKILCCMGQTVLLFCFFFLVHETDAAAVLLLILLCEADVAPSLLRATLNFGKVAG